MARFCVRTGLSPDDYKKLTWVQYQAFAEELNANG